MFAEGRPRNRGSGDWSNTSSQAEVRERESEGVADFDRDSLHTLPLSMIPLDTPGLRRARMIKNARYESVVEMFKGEGTGSGQVQVDQLSNVFSQVTEKDLGVLELLSGLSSYDIYSLRILLREQEIPVNDYDELRLSEAKQRELDQYIGAFTRPLIVQVYGDHESVQEFSDIIQLFRQPDIAKARAQFNLLAAKLDLKILDIPQFLQDYGETYMSVSYFRQRLDQILPLIQDFRAALQELVQHPQMRQDREFVKTCANMAQTVDRVLKVLDDRFSVFDAGARDVDGRQRRPLPRAEEAHRSKSRPAGWDVVRAHGLYRRLGREIPQRERWRSCAPSGIHPQ